MREERTERDKEMFARGAKCVMFIQAIAWIVLLGIAGIVFVCCEARGEEPGALDFDGPTCIVCCPTPTPTHDPGATHFFQDGPYHSYNMDDGTLKICKTEKGEVICWEVKMWREE